METLANVLTLEGKTTEAGALYSEILEVLSAEADKGNVNALNRMAELASTRLEQGKFSEAEPLAREYLTLREKQIPGDWRTFDAQHLLGGALLGQKKYADAESLLIAGYEGMKQREATIPPEGKARLSKTLQRLAQLYEETNRPDQAAVWRKKLAESRALLDLEGRTNVPSEN